MLSSVSRRFFPRNLFVLRQASCVVIIRTIHLESSSPPSNLVPSRLIGTTFSPSLAASPVAPTRLVFSALRSLHSMGSEPSKATASIYDFTVKDAKGNDVNLSTYKGKVLMIVNVASECGLTNTNYTEMNQLYQKYKDKGFEILAFPCNQFGSQEPGTNEEIMQRACTRFKAEFPVFQKVDVNGANTAPVYKFLKSSKGGLFGGSIKWNFTKFIVDKDGNIVERYAPTTSPASIEKGLKKLLGIA
ncbi:PREDICTED: probable phospholipid hydroperoxide glutathione peroxidase [Ipomoea nil]|uniref:probable phospholipid hydroperoxide glutathione peroxidase n=1 Tax=Ipomoea nil TaxID=35883 RepID=UPI0009016948|nr:PREDICTED: probable phospholipid hydroperoxide glutathione peroxidase [Ipomoea nil]